MHKITLSKIGCSAQSFYCAGFIQAQNRVISYLAQDHGHRGTIRNEITGDLAVYSWQGDKLCINRF